MINIEQLWRDYNKYEEVIKNMKFVCDILKIKYGAQTVSTK